jgi:alkylhydroperoxidase family enzyme
VASSGSNTLVAAVLTDWRTAPISAKMRGTLGFLEKLTTAPAEVGPADLEPARAAGVSDQAMEEALYVCFLFSVMDRLADALDFEIHSAAEFQMGGRMLATRGYGGLSLPG